MSGRQERAAELRDIAASKDAWHARTAEAGHAMGWRLDDQGPGHSPTWYGACGNCGATMSVFPGGTSIGEGAWCARDVPCRGPETAWQHDMVRDLAHDRITAAVSRFGQAVKDNADRAWLAGQGLADHREPTPEPAAAWKELISRTAEFEPEDDGRLLSWMAGEAAGMADYAESVTGAYETAVRSVGLDPVAIRAMHDYADAVSEAAQEMAAARQKFAEFYAEIRNFTAGGNKLPYDGRWVTGEDGAA